MNIKELNGAYFKKALNANRCYFRYHNKSKNGGSFGFEMRGLAGGRDLELWGHYNADGEIHHLAIGEIFGRKSEVSKEIYSSRDFLISNLRAIYSPVSITKIGE